MLTNKEKIIMKYLLTQCKDKDTVLVYPIDIAHIFEPKFKLKTTEVESLLDGLTQENYISKVNSDKKGELVYCISILPKGKAYLREEKNKKINWGMAITRTIILAVISFVIGIILKAIF